MFRVNKAKACMNKKMAAARTFEASVNICQTARRNSPEDLNFYHLPSLGESTNFDQFSVSSTHGDM